MAIDIVYYGFVDPVICLLMVMCLIWCGLIFFVPYCGNRIFLLIPPHRAGWLFLFVKFTLCWKRDAMCTSVWCAKNKYVGNRFPWVAV